MPCEHYKDALIDVAASGATLQGELRAHLDECASCRVAFDEEHSLFSAIDSELHAAVNGEIPSTLIPRVRAGLNEVAFTHTRGNFGWFALTAAATVAAVLFLMVRVLQNNVESVPTNSVANLPAAPETNPAVQPPSLLSPREAERLPRNPLVSTARNAKPLNELAVRGLQPEVLVPHDQEVLLADYAQQWTSRTRAPLVANEVVDVSLEPLQVSPIQITHLDVKPLAEEGSR